MQTLQIEGVIHSKEGAILNLRVCGSSKVFRKNIFDIYAENDWMEKFSSEDVAYLGFLAGTTVTGTANSEKTESQNSSFTKNTVYIGMLFVCFLLLSNLTAFKVGIISVPFSDIFFEYPAALIFFPATYIFNTILTEVYGYKIARMIIWGSFFCSFLILSGLWAVLEIPVSPEWQKNSAGLHESFELFVNSYLRIFFASAIAYPFGEFMNAIVLAKLKILSKGKNLGVRIVSSSALAVSVDSTIFCSIAFYGVMLMTSIL